MKISVKPVKVNIGFKTQKIYPKADPLQVIPSEKEQGFSGVYKDITVKPIPDKYVVPKVKDNVLILSRGEVEGGVLNL